MRIDIITIFPDIFPGPLSESILGRAADRGLIEINTVDLRNFTHDSRRTVDDRPYGGGPGMLMKPKPVFEAVESLKTDSSFVVLLTPQGERFSQRKARELAAKEHIVMICGHYEGVDERIRTALADIEISIGDYVLTSGNLPAMIVCDAVARLVPGALGSSESQAEESFSEGLIEYPQYTRPPEYRGMKVPEILLSGNHEAIARWRKEQSLERTKLKRPDLLGENKNNIPEGK